MARSPAPHAAERYGKRQYTTKRGLSGDPTSASTRDKCTRATDPRLPPRGDIGVRFCSMTGLLVADRRLGERRRASTSSPSPGRSRACSTPLGPSSWAGRSPRSRSTERRLRSGTLGHGRGPGDVHRLPRRRLSGGRGNGGADNPAADAQPPQRRPARVHEPGGVGLHGGPAAPARRCARTRDRGVPTTYSRSSRTSCAEARRSW